MNLNPESIVYNADCMDIMKGYPDKYFDLAVVDPPYGINRLHSGGMAKSSGFKKWERKDWDSSIPKIEYWNELFRLSKNQIVWGGITLLNILNQVKDGFFGLNKKV